MVDTGFLSGVEIFEGVDAGQLAKIQECCETLELSEGEKIFSQRDKAEYIYFVMEGKVDLRFDLPTRETSKAMNIASVEPGHSFGWSTVVEVSDYKLSAYASGDNCKVGKIKGDNLRKVFETDCGTGYKVISHIARLAASRFLAMQTELISCRGSEIIDGW